MAGRMDAKGMLIHHDSAEVVKQSVSQPLQRAVRGGRRVSGARGRGGGWRRCAGVCVAGWLDGGV